MSMRKASRAMDAAFALEVLDKAPYITVSFTRPDGTPYGVPLSLARTDDKTFYFHCALEGEKLDCIATNPVWLCRQSPAARLPLAPKMAASHSSTNRQWRLVRPK